MMSKERLEDIKRKEAYLEGTNDLVMVIETDDYRWLIEQAERVQELEMTVDFFQSALRDADRRVQQLESDSYNAHLERLLDRREQQNKRYREALEFYAEKDNYEPKHFDPNINNYMSTVDYDEGKKAIKALEGEE